MGEGMKRAFASAKATRVRQYEITTSVRRFTVAAETSTEARRLAKEQLAAKEFITACNAI